jgi:hypothetical protein
LAEFFEIFAVEDAIVVHEEFLTLLAELNAIEKTAAALKVPSPIGAMRVRVEAAYRNFRDDITRLAQVTAVDFDKRARAILQGTARRDDTRVAPHLRNLIQSRPASLGFAALPIGVVGLGRVSTLERAVNPNTPGYGAYWRAQEYGTGRDGVPKQAGRRIRGYFYRPGFRDPQRPQAQYRGSGDPGYPIFMPGRPVGMPASARGGIGPGGGQGGPGLIHHEIQPRRFLRGASDGAWGDYIAGVKAVQSRALSSLAGL